MKISKELRKDLLQLALVQWYDFKLKRTPYKYECAYIKLTDIYNIVEIEAIHDIVHVIPRFGKKNEYLINKFIF
jgi:hypothetical protein